MSLQAKKTFATVDFERCSPRECDPEMKDAPPGSAIRKTGFVRPWRHVPIK